MTAALEHQHLTNQINFGNWVTLLVSACLVILIRLFSISAKGNVSSTRVLLDEVPLSLRVRATGPKTYHMSRSLVFVPPEEYKGLRKKHPLLRSKSFEHNLGLQNEHTVQYHTHTGNIYIR